METMGLPIPSTSDALRRNFTVLHHSLHRQLANSYSAKELRWELTKLRNAIVKNVTHLLSNRGVIIVGLHNQP